RSSDRSAGLAPDRCREVRKTELVSQDGIFTGGTCFRTSRTRRSASLHTFCVSLPHRQIAIASISPAAWLPTRQTFTGTNSVGNGRRTVRYFDPEFFVLEFEKNAGRLTGKDSKISRATVPAFSRFLADQV